MELAIIVIIILAAVYDKQSNNRRIMEEEAEDFRRAYDPNDPMTRAQAIMRMYARRRK